MLEHATRLCQTIGRKWVVKGTEVIDENVQNLS